MTANAGGGVHLRHFCGCDVIVKKKRWCARVMCEVALRDKFKSQASRTVTCRKCAARSAEPWQGGSHAKADMRYSTKEHHDS